jgi:preprotein translocase subunit SecA
MTPARAASTDQALQRVLARFIHKTTGPSIWSDESTGTASPSVRLRVLDSHKSEPQSTVLDRWGRWFGALAGRWLRPLPRLKRLAREVQVNASAWTLLNEPDFKQVLREAAADCKMNGSTGLDRRSTAADLRALAVVAEAVRRVHGFSPHLEQLIGALALLEGRLAEMATGEGKTLTAAMAAVVAAWRGLPCHVVTANDYLAARDAQIGLPLFSLCEVSAASVTGETPPQARGSAYQHDIVYTTAKDLLADHLRDGLALGQGAYRTRFALGAARHGEQAGVQGVVMRGVHQVIVDEADSVLIDEAVTPLIISAQRPDDLLEQAAREAVTLARGLREKEDFKIEKALRHIEWTPGGRSLLQQLARDMPPFWRRVDRAEELVQMALYAMHLMVRDQHYVVEGEKVILVDELTGRLAQQRTLSLGMQQVLEASLGLPISPPSEVSARSSFQRFFRRFARLGGMTGTAREARKEFAEVYGLTTVQVPTHRPIRRRHQGLRVLRSEAEKFEAVAQACEELVKQGRAVLIGLRSVRSSRLLGQCVRRRLPDARVDVLHALEHERESAIVAAAGRSGAITIATNMAGRGTDIALDPAVHAAGGLHVIVAEVNDYARIDRQLIGRCARQGDPGSVQVFVALDDELLRRFLPPALAWLWAISHRGLPPLRRPLAQLVVRMAQNRATRLSFRQRQNILEQDTELERDGF